MKLSKTVLVALLISTAALSGCGTRSGQDARPDSVTIRLQWHMQAQFAGYYVAKALGYYRKQNLDVTIAEGGYSKNNLITVGEGVEQFGTKWPFDLLPQGKKFITIANIVKENGLLLVSRKELGIRTIRDLPGKKVSIWFIGNEFQLYSALEQNGIDRKKVKIVAQKWDLSQFLNREVDAFAAMQYNELLQILAKGIPLTSLNIINLSKAGITYPGHCIFTSREYFNANRDICRRFVQASLQGWQFTVKNPQQAVRLLMKFDEKKRLDPGFQLKQLQELIKLIRSGNTPLGYHDPAVFNTLINTAKRYRIIPGGFSQTGFYTNALLPEVK